MRFSQAAQNFGSQFRPLALVTDDYDGSHDGCYSDGCETEDELEDDEMVLAGALKPNTVGYVSAAVVKAASLAAGAVVSGTASVVNAVSSAVGACVRTVRKARGKSMAIHPDTVRREFTQVERLHITKEIAKQSQRNFQTFHLLQKMQACLQAVISYRESFSSHTVPGTPSSEPRPSDCRY